MNKLCSKWLLAGSVFFALLLLNACNSSTEEAQPVQPRGLVGQAAPDFTLRDIQGKEVKLSQFKGQVVVLNFWATWCPPCREEMPSMEKLYRDNREKGLVILAVNVDENGKKAVSDFLQRTPYSFPILLDDKNIAQQTYGVFRFPESFIIDRNGKVVEKIIGGRDWLSGATFKLIDFLLNG
jgi:peroxiredoxin